MIRKIRAQQEDETVFLSYYYQLRYFLLFVYQQERTRESTLFFDTSLSLITSLHLLTSFHLITSFLLIIVSFRSLHSLQLHFAFSINIHKFPARSFENFLPQFCISSFSCYYILSNTSLRKEERNWLETFDDNHWIMVWQYALTIWWFDSRNKCGFVVLFNITNFLFSLSLTLYY